MSDSNAATQLRTLLGGLCSTDEDNAILDQLCEKVTEVNENSIEFEDNSCSYSAGIDNLPAGGPPASFSEISKTVSSLTWDGGGPEVGYEVCEDGSSCADGWIFDEIDEDVQQRVNDAGGPADAFVAGQNGLFFDPTRKLANGEPALAFVSHDDCEWTEVSSVDELDYKQVFLRMIADAMVDTDHIGEIWF